MGLRIIVGYEGGNRESSVEHAVFYCSTTDTAFGPVIYSKDGEALQIAELFLDYVDHKTGERDLRAPGVYHRVEALFCKFMALADGGGLKDFPVCRCGHAASEHDWTSGSYSNRRHCQSYVKIADPEEDGGYREEDCGCDGGWVPADKKTEGA